VAIFPPGCCKKNLFAKLLRWRLTSRGWRGEGGGYRGAAAASGRAAPDSSTARRRLAAATLIGSDQTRPLRKALSHIRDLGGLIPVHLHLRPAAAAEEEVQ